jgi:hypothetical protein
VRTCWGPAGESSHHQHDRGFAPKGLETPWGRRKQKSQRGSDGRKEEPHSLKTAQAQYAPPRSLDELPQPGCGDLACTDDDLRRQPDRVKFVYATYFSEHEPGRRKTAQIELLLNLRTPQIVAEPVPWKTSDAARRDYLRTWRKRDWLSWLEERMEFPFRALMPLPSEGKKLTAVQATGLLHPDADQAGQIGSVRRTPHRGWDQGGGADESWSDERLFPRVDASGRGSCVP